MLTIFLGNNTSEVRQKALAFVHGEEENGKVVTRITAEQYSVGVFADLAGGSSLFGEESVILIDTPSEDAAVHEAVLENLVLFEKSTHSFVIIEQELNVALKKKYGAHGELHEIAKKEKETFNTFALTDALLLRDKKTLWILLTEALKFGVTHEEIIGVLFWQLKVLRLAEKTASAEDAGQKPFVYQKAKRALTKFKPGELQKLSQELLTVYHDGHMGRGDIGLQLEKWVLGV